MVFFPPPIRDATGGIEQSNAAGRNVRELLRDLEPRFPGLAARLTSGDKLAPGLMVFVDGVASARGLWTEVGPESEVHFIPALSGGSQSIR